MQHTEQCCKVTQARRACPLSSSLLPQKEKRTTQKNWAKTLACFASFDPSRLTSPRRVPDSKRRASEKRSCPSATTLCVVLGGREGDLKKTSERGCAGRGCWSVLGQGEMRVKERERKREREKIIVFGGVRTHASEETTTSRWRLGPLGHEHRASPPQILPTQQLGELTSCLFASASLKG